jgi:branched-chain amino acid transport system ATP-binding protein
MLLEIKGMTKYFGGLLATSEIDMNVNEGEIVGLLGPNGAGKTTLFNLITGVLRPTRGRIFFDGTDITGKKLYQTAELGIGRTFQLNPLFKNFTVLENVKASFYLHPRSSWLGTFFNSSSYRRNEDLIEEQSSEILNLIGLDRVRDVLAKNLPHGYQKMLSIARALAIKPRLLLLDEPLSGMNPDEIDFTMASIKKMRQQGITIVVIEHNLQIMDICDRVLVINFGRKIAEGTPAEIKKNKEVIEAYFGEEYVT